MLAAKQGHSSVIKTLVKANASLDAKDEKGQTALIKATANS